MKTAELLECGHPESEHSSSTRGYGVLNGKRHCYECCAKMDKEQMRKDGKTTLYLSKNRITNWPGSLSIPIKYQKTGMHNIARTRIDAWFTFEGEEWHGVQYGEWTQIIHCKRNKSK